MIFNIFMLLVLLNRSPLSEILNLHRLGGQGGKQVAKILKDEKSDTEQSPQGSARTIHQSPARSSCECRARELRILKVWKADLKVRELSHFW
jgi:hypothetical protein